MTKEISNNYIHVTGCISSDVVYSHDAYSERFYKFKIKSKRLSGAYDTLTVISSGLVIFDRASRLDGHIDIVGQIRTYNKFDEVTQRSRLKVVVFALDIVPIEFDDREDINSVSLNGYICKPVTFRETPYGRTIADVLLAVNREYGKSDYMPCIAWYKSARYVRSLSVGNSLNVSARMQSREYLKSTDRGEIEKRTAYEVSILRINMERDELEA